MELEVGHVKDVYFEENYSGRVVAVLAVTSDFPIPKNSTARIFSSDLMGSKRSSHRPRNLKSYGNSGRYFVV